ncbi:MAG: VCBS repeat-containing protein, partial [Desulfuromonadaceae bacterium]|nr:VCBS repeat-containing protein [Desulfuromonadaceae bacterium]
SISGISSNHDVVATFEAYQYMVTASATGNGGSLTPVSLVYGDAGDQPAFKLVQYDGYQINPRVDTCGSTTTGTQNPYDLVVEPLRKNCELTFTFVTYPGWFEILTSAGAGGTITPIAAVYPSASRTITVTPNSGYHILSVTVDGVAQTLSDLKAFSVNFTNIIAGHTVNALFAKDESDFNGDGRPDIVWTNSADATNNTYTVWNMSGATKVSETAFTNPAAPGQLSPGVGWALVAKGDFDNDGKVDVVWRNQTTGQNKIWFMNGTAKKGEAALPTVPAPWVIDGVADFNSDGKADILWRRYDRDTNNTFVWYLNGATPTAASAYLPNVPAVWKIDGVADFNSDGKADILWRRYDRDTNNTFVWYLNGATPTAASAYLPNVPGVWGVKMLADFNNDGKTDILWRRSDRDTNNTFIWYLNGATPTAASAYLPNQAAAWQAVGK